MTQRTTTRKPNGLPGPHGRPNGHGPAFAERGGAPVPACPDRHRGHAASDDASGMPVACAPASAAASLPSQASTDREAYAEAAPPAPHEPPQKPPRNTGGGSQDTSSTDKKELPPGKHPLPDNPAEFVEEIHRKTDLIEAWDSLLRSKDEKVKQRAIEKLTAMLYENDAISAEEPQQIVLDIDSAVARRAAEGATR
jgi:hypothetical protein